MTAALLILVVMAAVAGLLNPSREQFAAVAADSAAAAWLLVPYLLWSPVGTLVTWQMQRLNR
jgi:tryptophan-rich sensory protein